MEFTQTNTIVSIDFASVKNLVIYEKESTYLIMGRNTLNGDAKMKLDLGYKF